MHVNVCYENKSLPQVLVDTFAKVPSCLLLGARFTLHWISGNDNLITKRLCSQLQSFSLHSQTHACHFHLSEKDAGDGDHDYSNVRSSQLLLIVTVCLCVSIT